MHIDFNTNMSQKSKGKIKITTSLFLFLFSSHFANTGFVKTIRPMQNTNAFKSD